MFAHRSCGRLTEGRQRFDGVVVITSASHAEGREFKPRSNLFLVRTLVESHHTQISFWFVLYKKSVGLSVREYIYNLRRKRQVYFVVAG